MYSRYESKIKHLTIYFIILNDHGEARLVETMLKEIKLENDYTIWVVVMKKLTKPDWKFVF